MTIPNTTYRVLVEKLGDSSSSQFIGNEGELFYDPNFPVLKLSNGTTAGGVSINGTGGDTGYITFNENKIIGFGTGSGDGNQFSTIELVPDNDLYGGNQYIIVDPTAPNHIHLRAGGTQDESNVQLFLGGEKNYVRVTDGTGIRLQNEDFTDNSYFYSDGNQFINGSWTPFNESVNFVQFDTTDTTFINNCYSILNDARNVLEVTTNAGVYTFTVTSFDNLGGDTWAFNINESPPSGAQTINQIVLTLFVTWENRVVLENNDFTVYAGDDVRITANDLFQLRNISPTDPISIVTDYDGNSRYWSFQSNGILTFPDNSEQTTAYVDRVSRINTNSALEAEIAVGPLKYRISSLGNPQVLSNGSPAEKIISWSTIDSCESVITGGTSEGLFNIDDTNWVGLTTANLTSAGDSTIATIIEPSTGLGYKVTFVRSAFTGTNTGGIVVERIFDAI